MSATTNTQRNLELKVRCTATKLAAVETQLASLVCSPASTFHQVDTYFVVGRGRLKLREFLGEGSLRAELIGYHRPSDGGSRWSDYVVLPVQGERVSLLREALLMTHEVLTVVDKVRQVEIVGHTRVHMDTVADLGTFVELETVARGIDDDVANAEHAEVIARLGLGELESVAGSYSDLMLRRGDV